MKGLGLMHAIIGEIFLPQEALPCYICINIYIPTSMCTYAMYVMCMYVYIYIGIYIYSYTCSTPPHDLPLVGRNRGASNGEAWWSAAEAFNSHEI